MTLTGGDTQLSYMTTRQHSPRCSPHLNPPRALRYPAPLRVNERHSRQPALYDFTDTTATSASGHQNVKHGVLQATVTMGTKRTFTRVNITTSNFSSRSRGDASRSTEESRRSAVPTFAGEVTRICRSPKQLVSLTAGGEDLLSAHARN